MLRYSSKTILSGFLAMGIGLAVAFPMQAAQQEEQGQAQQEEQAAQEKHEGTVEEIGKNEIVVKLKGREKTHRHKITDQTQFFLEGKKVQPGELKPGDEVKITVQEEDPDAAARIQATRKQGQAQEQPRRQQRPREEQRRRQPPKPQRPPRQPQQPQAAEDQQASLGVAVVRGEEEGVRVENVAPNSPAAKAGIQRDDLIISIEGTDVSQPRDLLEQVSRKDPGTQIKIRIQRNGETREINATLQRRSEVFRREREARPGQRREFRPEERERRMPREERRRQTGQRPREAWMGVLLSRTDGTGGQIVRIHPQGPAAQSQLQEGDIILGIDGQEVSAPSDVARIIEEKEPNAQTEIRVRRNGQEETFNITLGDREELYRQQPTRDFPRYRDEFGFRDRRGREAPRMRGREDQMMERNRRLERITRELMREVRRLREDVEQLKRQMPQQGRQRQQIRPERAPRRQPQEAPTRERL